MCIYIYFDKWKVCYIHHVHEDNELVKEKSNTIMEKIRWRMFVLILFTILSADIGRFVYFLHWRVHDVTHYFLLNETTMYL